MRDLYREIIADPFFLHKVIKQDNTEVECVVFMLKDTELALLPEGMRYNPTIRIFSRDPFEGKEIIQYKTTKFIIVTASIWSEYGYYDSTATRYEGSQTRDSKGFEYLTERSRENSVDRE